jgi:hypothetical protein
MKKGTLVRRTALVLGLAVCLAGIVAHAWAAETDSISVTVSLQSVISVAVLPHSWAIGGIGLNSTTGPQAFSATVGNTATKLEIMGANGAGGWTIGTSAVADQFKVAVSDPAINLSTAYQELAASVAAYGKKDFSLTYSAPTSDTRGGGVDQGFSITLKASTP